MGLLHRRTSRVLALALAAVWVVTLAFADTAVTPAMRCQRGHMPCCPRTGDSEGCAGENCSAARCTEQVPEKAEGQAGRVAEREAAALPGPRLDDGNQGAGWPVRELTSGLRYQSPVFRLKDDLRI
jgi:hypothetical protein